MTTPPAPSAPAPTPLNLFEKISEWWRQKSVTKKVLIFLSAVAIFTAIWFFTRNVKISDTKTKEPAAAAAAPVASEPPPVAPAAASTPTMPTGSINVTNPAVPITVNGGTVNGGITVILGNYYSSVETPAGGKITPSRPPEDTFVRIVPGMAELTIGPGKIAYADFEDGMRGFRFSYDSSRTNDVRALYDGVPLIEKHNPDNTERLTIQNTSRRDPLKLEFSGR